LPRKSAPLKLASAAESIDKLELEKFAPLKLALPVSLKITPEPEKFVFEKFVPLAEAFRLLTPEKFEPEATAPSKSAKSPKKLTPLKVAPEILASVKSTSPSTFRGLKSALRR